MNTKPTTPAAGETRHTPEPWIMHPDSVRFSCVVQNSASQMIAETGQNRYIHEATHGANAARIVAAVNACAGMSDPAAEIAALREACDLLLNAEGAVFGTEYSNDLLANAVKLARAAMKGGGE